MTQCKYCNGFDGFHYTHCPKISRETPLYGAVIDTVNGLRRIVHLGPGSTDVMVEEFVEPNQGGAPCQKT